MKYRPPRLVGGPGTDRPLAAVTAPPAAGSVCSAAARTVRAANTPVTASWRRLSLSVIPQINAQRIGPPPAPWRGSNGTSGSSRRGGEANGYTD